MRKTMNPDQRNFPCETGAADNLSAMESQDLRFTCSRCGAGASLPENLCAPVEK